MKRLKALFAGLALGALFGALIDPERRNKAKKLFQELRVKVTERAKNLSSVSKEAYENMVDATVAEYKQMRSLTFEEVGHVTKELKDAWEDIRKSVQ